MAHRFRTLGFALALAFGVAGLQAQEATFIFTPDAAPPGVTRTIQVTAPPQSGIDYIAIGCQLNQVWSGGPNGTSIPVFGPICAVIPIPLPPCGTASATWTPPAALAPGTWWMRFIYLLPGTFQAVTKWVDFRIDSPPEPTLTAPQPVTGQPWTLSLSHPTAPGAAYIAAASLTTDTGLVAAPGSILTLDPDVLFLASFPNPLPGLFTNFQGNLDGVGSATLTVNIPNVPGINCIGLHVQAFVIGGGTPGVLSNCVDDTIL